MFLTKIFFTKYVAPIMLVFLLLQQQGCSSASASNADPSQVGCFPTKVQPARYIVGYASLTIPLGITFSVDQNGNYSVSFTGVEIPTPIGTFKIGARVKEAEGKKTLTIVLGDEKHVYDMGNTQYEVSIPNDKHGKSKILYEAAGNIYVIVPDPIFLTADDSVTKLLVFIDGTGQVFFGANAQKLPVFLGSYPIYLNTPKLPEKTLTVVIEDKKLVYDLQESNFEIAVSSEQGELAKDKTGSFVLLARPLASRGSTSEPTKETVASPPSAETVTPEPEQSQTIGENKGIFRIWDRDHNIAYKKVESPQ